MLIKCLGPLNKNKKHVISVLINAKNTAIELSPNIIEVLVKGVSPHKNYYKSRDGKIEQYPLHYRYEFKTAELAKRGTHWTAHANVRRDPPKAWYDLYDTILRPKYESDGKTLSEDRDQFYHQKKKEMCNHWDPKNDKFTEFEEEFRVSWKNKGTGTTIAYTTEELYEVSPEEEEIRQAQLKSMEETEKFISQD